MVFSILDDMADIISALDDDDYEFSDDSLDYENGGPGVYVFFHLS